MVNTSLNTTIKALETSNIPKDRLDILQPLIVVIKECKTEEKPLILNFICTHNSRRSLLCQAWAQAMASYFEIKGILCYSGGTEATRVYPKIVETLSDQGFDISVVQIGDNPIYNIAYNEEAAPIIGFSKTWDDDFNPESHFIAVMTCSQADEGCPYIPGAMKRIPVTYEDPKVSDGSAQETETYLKRSQQIATEMRYVFSQLTP